MSEWSYLIVVAAGAVMIWHHAFSHFEAPLRVDEDQRYPILNEVEIKDLTSDSVYRFGRWTYIAIFLIAYAIGLQVWDVVESISSGNPTSQDPAPRAPSRERPRRFSWTARATGGRSTSPAR